MEDPKVTGEVTIQLDRPCKIKLAGYSQFRISLHRDKLSPRKGIQYDYHQVVTCAWAMLSKEDLKRFPDPEDLAEYITLENVTEYLAKILEAINLGTPSEKKRLPRAMGIPTRQAWFKR